MYPLKMNPAFKDYLWGGTRLRDIYGKRTDLPIVAESWEISCHPDGPSTVALGGLEGKTLAEALALHPGWTGERCARLSEFPLLIKLIDAKQALSLQVHPGDEYARRVEKQLGKNEMWYVLEAEPGAELILGFQHPVGRDELRKRIADQTLTEITRSVPVKPGDCYCIPAGMLHAIGAGILVAEVQQSSNVTYRVYDYGRRGPDGNPRELHIEKALDVVDTSLRAENSGHIAGPLANWPYFQATLLQTDARAELDCDSATFRCALVASGSPTLHWAGGRLPLCPGESVFLPAGLGRCSFSGHCTVLLAGMEHSHNM